MIGFLRRVLVLVALVAFGWAGWRYVQEEGLLGAEPAAESEIAPRSAPASPPPPSPAVEAGDTSAAIVRPDSVRPQSAPRRARTGESAEADELAGTINPEADIAYNAPATMRLGQPTSIQLVLDASGNADLRELLEGFTGEVREARVAVAGQVASTLTGPGFDIQPLSVERQALDSSAENRWQWNVRPLQEGRRVLVLDVYAYVGGAAQRVRTYRDEIEVSVNTLDRVIAYAQTAHPVVGLVAGGVSLILAGFGLARRRRERRERDGR